MRIRAAAAALCLAGLALVGPAAACGSGSSPAPAASAAAAVVLRVDGEPVTQADIDAIRAELRLAGATDSAATARAQALRRLLIRREAAGRGVTVAEAAVSSRLAELAEAHGGGEALAAARQAAGLTTAQLAAAVRYGLLEHALAAALFPAERPHAADIAAFYRTHRTTLFTRPAQIRLRRLTVPSAGLARRIAAEIRGGEPFAAAARHYSMDNETRYDGGLLGWVSATTLPAEVREALAPVAVGEISAPVLSLGRWHLFRVLGRRPYQALPLSRARPAIARELTRQKQTAALNDWVRQALEQASVADGS